MQVGPRVCWTNLGHLDTSILGPLTSLMRIFTNKIKIFSLLIVKTWAPSGIGAPGVCNPYSYGSFAPVTSKSQKTTVTYLVSLSLKLSQLQNFTIKNLLQDRQWHNYEGGGYVK